MQESSTRVESCGRGRATRPSTKYRRWRTRTIWPTSGIPVVTLMIFEMLRIVKVIALRWRMSRDQAAEQVTISDARLLVRDIVSYSSKYLKTYVPVYDQENVLADGRDV